MKTPYLDLPAARESDDAALTGVTQYLSGFLAQPNTALQAVGRPGNVCPFTRMALESNAIRFGRQAIDPHSPTAREDLMRAMREEHRERFFTEVDEVVSDRRFASLLVLIDGPQSPEECDELVSQTQKALQPDFVTRGLLMSELHPHNTVPSLHNPQFFPSRPPHPFHFIRRIVERDIPF